MNLKTLTAQDVISMVTFSCDGCNDTVKKPKASQHAQRCRTSLTCIDCSRTFWSGDWASHNSCISEAEAYQGALYKPTKKELKRKAVEQAAEQATATKLVVEAPASAVTAPVEAVLPTTTSSDTIVSSSKRHKKNEKTGSVEEKDSPKTMLTAMIKDGQSISLHKALKLLKGQQKLDKEDERSFLKQVFIKKHADGQLLIN